MKLLLEKLQLINHISLLNLHSSDGHDLVNSYSYQSYYVAKFADFLILNFVQNNSFLATILSLSFLFDNLADYNRANQALQQTAQDQLNRFFLLFIHFCLIILYSGSPRLVALSGQQPNLLSCLLYQQLKKFQFNFDNVSQVQLVDPVDYFFVFFFAIAYYY